MRYLTHRATQGDSHGGRERTMTHDMQQAETGVIDLPSIRDTLAETTFEPNRPCP